MYEELQEIVKRVEGCYPMVLTYDSSDLETGVVAVKDAFDKFLTAVSSMGIRLTKENHMLGYLVHHAQIVTAIKSIEYASKYPFCKLKETLSYLLRDMRDYLVNELAELDSVAPKHTI